MSLKRLCPFPSPLVIDDIDGWLPQRSVNALRAHGIKTLADLTVRVPRRRRWWTTVPGLGALGAREIEAFFDAHPELTERARALVRLDTRGDVVPLEQLIVPAEVDGSQGTFRGPVGTCTLTARNEYEAVNAWLSMHESVSTQRAYRKEAERLILWAVLERRKALSSLTELTTVRDNLRHASIQTTSIYLHGDEMKRAKQMEGAFGERTLPKR